MLAVMPNNLNLPQHQLHRILSVDKVVADLTYEFQFWTGFDDTFCFTRLVAECQSQLKGAQQHY